MIRPALRVERIVGKPLRTTAIGESGRPQPKKRREADDWQIERPENERLDRVSVFVHEQAIVDTVAALAQEDERPKRKRRPVFPNGHNRTMV